MKWLDLNLQTFKKVEKQRGFSFMPTNTFTKNNKLILFKNQLTKSQKGEVLCLQTPSKNNRKRLGFFGKQ